MRFRPLRRSFNRVPLSLGHDGCRLQFRVRGVSHAPQRRADRHQRAEPPSAGRDAREVDIPLGDGRYHAPAQIHHPGESGEAAAHGRHRPGRLRGRCPQRRLPHRGEAPVQEQDRERLAEVREGRIGHPYHDQRPVHAQGGSFSVRGVPHGERFQHHPRIVPCRWGADPRHHRQGMVGPSDRVAEGQMPQGRHHRFRFHRFPQSVIQERAERHLR